MTQNYLIKPYKLNKASVINDTYLSVLVQPFIWLGVNQCGLQLSSRVWCSSIVSLPRRSRRGSVCRQVFVKPGLIRYRTPCFLKP